MSTRNPSELVLFPLPVLAIKGAACFSCLKPAERGEKLNRCKGCKRAFYCSSECQKKDWKKNHKNVCPVLEEINKLDAPCEPRSWEDYRGDMWIRIDAFRNQPVDLKLNDERILQYQPHCSECHRNIFQLPTSVNALKLCHTCSLAHTCVSCTPTKHFQHCRTHYSVSIAERFAIKHYLETQEPNLTLFTLEPRKVYLPLSEMKSWKDYYTIMSTQAGIEHLITAVLDPIPNQEDPIDKIVDMSNALKAGTDKLSMILSIFAALEVVFPPTSPTLPSSGLQEKQHITLHLIGATAKELDALMLFEELLHLLPNLRSIHCDFIGLELPRPVDDGTITLSCCEACTSLKCTRSMSMFKGSYTEFIRAQQVFKKPDLAVLFHTGHSQESVEEWKPAVQFLATAGFPSMFTCFNGKEMEEETAGLKSIGAKFLVEGCENRWRGLRPLLEVAEETEGATFFMNGFWYVIKGET